MAYDIGEALDRIEEELIASMIRNMGRHRIEEIKEEKEWTMWQAEQLKSLRAYRQDNREKYSGRFLAINEKIEEAIRKSYAAGGMHEERKILRAAKKGAKLRQSMNPLTGRFFQLNKEKLEALIKATKADMTKAETAILRMADDQYRKAIFTAQVYANSGAGTYEQAVDMATKSMLSSGLNCVEYKNGARHTLPNYARMAVRTANKRAYLSGEGEKRRKWGITTVILAKRGNPCPKCAPFVGKVFIDDVWSGGNKKDGDYPLLSSAIGAGLYHPNCKDSHTTYFPELHAGEEKWTKEELEEVAEDYNREQKEKRIEQQVSKFERLSKFSLDPENKKQYARKAEQWKESIEPKTPVSNVENIAKDWVEVTEDKAKKVGEIKELLRDGTVFKVDGKSVVLDPNSDEKKIAELLAKKFGKEVLFVPRVNFPQGIKTPDLQIDGEYYDLKTLQANASDTTIYQRVKKGKGQANNFLIDISKSGLSDETVDNQIKAVYTSKHTSFVDKLLIIKDSKIIRAVRKK